MQRIKLCLFLWGLLYISVLPSSAQSIPSDSAIFIPTGSIKNNLLYDATLTPNIGLEVKIGSRSTFQVFYGINPWKFSDTKKWRHWSLMPEYRYWLKKEKAPYLLGWFTGVHALGGEFNVGGVDMPFGMMKWLKDNRYEGWFIGGGLTLGHAWRLSDRWRLEAAVGVGYIRFRYDRYQNEWCGDFIHSGTYDYFGPTKLALNIAYNFGKKQVIKPVVVEVPVVIEKPAPYTPSYELAYIEPQAEKEKSRHLSGQAYLSFLVNKTDIRRDYRNNAVELSKVEETINVVRKDPNTTITHIDIHGYASPEGSFANNKRLAEGRAQAFKDYVQQLIDLPANIFSVASTPEDWEGLVSKIDHPAILDIAKSDAEPDAKERLLKQRYPAQWKQLLADVFPTLRHSDYRVSYTIRPFTVEEARDIIRTKPQQLSLNEMFLVANTYAPGSKDYDDVFETAVRLYPDDETANLNAAVIALRKDNLEAASRYLTKAGQSAEAQNARGVLAAKQGDYAAAETAFGLSTIKEAKHNLEELQRFLNSQ